MKITPNWLKANVDGFLKKDSHSLLFLFLVAVLIRGSSVLTDYFLWEKNLQPQLEELVAKHVIVLEPKPTIREHDELFSCSDYIEVIRYLLKQGLDSNAKDTDSLTLLMGAVILNDYSLVDLLLQHGAELDIENDYGATALVYAVRAGHTAMAEYLITKGALFDQRDDRGSYVLQEAIYAGNPFTIHMLLKHGLDIEHEMFSLIIAMTLKRIDLMELLIENGVNLTYSGNLGASLVAVPLFLSSEEGKALLEQQKIVEFIPRDLKFTHAEINEMVKIVLDNKAPMSSDLLNSPLLAMAALKNQELLRMLLEHHLDPNTIITDPRMSLLSLAVRAGCKDAVSLLLDYGALVNWQSPYGATPLFYASTVDIATLLLKHNASVNHRDSNGNTPLGWYVLNDKVELAEFLIRHGASVTSKNNSGKSIVDIAKAGGNQTLINLLVKYGAK